jgi:hypothetical protein
MGAFFYALESQALQRLQPRVGTKAINKEAPLGQEKTHTKPEN